MFVLVPESTEVVEGKKVKFSCKATGKPTPNISWLIEDEPIYDSDDIKVTTSDGDRECESDMIFPKVSVEQESVKYKVQASNVAGIVEEDFSLVGKEYLSVMVKLE